MKTIIPTVVAIGAALIILLSMFIPNPTLFTVRQTLVDWAVVLAALAVLLGVLNLLIVHTRRLEQGERGAAYSLLTVIAVVFTLGIGVAESIGADGPVLYEATSMTNVLFRGVVSASLASLAALVMIFLVAAAVRLMRTRPGGWSLLFLGVVVVGLVGWIPLAALRPLGALRDWLMQVPAAAGSRGILLGVALGVLVIGVRFLMGAERPYTD